ncbi:MAG: bifunctional (p)ppGpp synthetase/guanosine-3',5'-bis(diphosphate) 3'-pyrophosphohydrolase [Ardenticatenaceae bacterium]|nr:bifunctional (p)ppGpp synthetase/guanosine-3',5'-bis(diphosphate) 3'-pyrophosphohydrolase [Anaerolineales bacterium]MCB8940926.1 bifunctional (p)ppGpp synthetase/guanosine-3',5'-bis(diphosphate) 3'-pyrophosphohydrolase [Ardenticatenaceae bacterium]MCB8972265.1 bifunctional (p)ppGpp synthetase/guanosine-3',5'-bis(diphosphate) 3'-pyrophosphohydrolase [Ardenticatenaceae bacterium]
MTQLSIVTINELLNHLPNGRSAQEVKRAYEFANQIHNGRQRDSGELYIEHDLAVTHTMSQLGVDPPTLIASMLHDSLLPHTGQTFETIKKYFGEEPASLIKGLEQLYAYASEEQYQRHRDPEADRKTLEGVRRAVLAIIEGDIRVILIRLADCLQDLRKASNLPPEQRYLVAHEAMNIYAPLANRLGIWQLKWELEDLAFRYLQPEKYKEIASQLAARRAERMENIDLAVDRLERIIRENGLIGSVSGRSKHIYSIYRKMVRKQLDFDNIFDIQALRVILEPKDKDAYAKKSTKEKEEEDRYLCYQVLGLVHSLWQPIPREFDDYIAAPKSNGYQSLHTAVIDTKTGENLEVQIRTRRMHDEAEKGVAAHWTYKEEGGKVASSVKKRIDNLRELLASLQEDSHEDDDNTLLENELLGERIYVFTPKGDVIDLPAGSTPIDFAYAIHTEVGHRCRGARVDGKMVSLDYLLKSGERVSILTTNRGGPSRDWMNGSLGYTGSTRTRSKIRQWFRNQEREQNILQGREVVERELRRLGLGDTYTVSDIAQSLKFTDEEQFLAKVGFGDIQSRQISGAIALMEKNLHPDDELRPLLLQQPTKKQGLTITGVTGLHTRMAKCCQPIPPEPITGFITRGQGVTIHRSDCKEVINTTEPERLIDVDWGDDTAVYPIPIVLKAYRRPNIIEEIVAILRGQRINTPKTKSTSVGNIMTISLIVEVKSLEQLNWLLQKLESLPNVIEAHRQRW